MPTPNHHPASSPVFISEDRTIHTGDRAAALLAQKNDAANLDPDSGILRATRERWLEAQRYERKTWMTDFRTANDDRNQTHAQNFDHYASLRGSRFTHAIELGCGPFTNIRLIAQTAQIENLDLLDPLLNDYLAHPNCTYSNGALSHPPPPGEVAASFGAAGGGSTSTASPSPTSSLSPPSLTLHPTSIEDFHPSHPYDLIVMVNVLEHCFDAQAIFRRILDMAAPHATFIFHDRYYSAPDLAHSLRAEYDAGHPLRIDRAVIDAFLADHFTPLFSRTVRFERHKWGADRSYDGIYFIGTLS